jgi:hypothetical protein
MANFLSNAGRALFGGGSSTTYKPPNLDFLRDAAPAVNYDFLREATDRAGGLAGGGTFSDYINSIQAPSSVDQVRSEVDQTGLNNTLNDIERDTRQRFGQGIMEQYLKGLTGDGSSSDIAGNALAQIASSGGRAASDAYTKMYMANLDRLSARDQAARDAYGQRYQMGEQEAGNLLSQYAQGLTGNADREMQRRLGLAGNLTTGAGQQAQATQRNPGILRNIADNIQIRLGT